MAVTIQDVAAAARVSPATVSKFLNTPHRVSPETSKRVAAAIADLGYVRNDAARGLRAGHSRTLGLLAYDMENPFFTALAHEVEKHAATHGMAVLLGNSWGDPSRERAYLDLFEERRLHGVLVSPLGSIGDRVKQLQKRGTRVVLVDQEDPGISSVSVNDVTGGYLAAAHLISRGSRRLAFVGGPQNLRQVTDRLKGARNAVAEHEGVTIEVIDLQTRTVSDGRAAGEQILMRPPNRRPDALFAVNDRVAFGLLHTLLVEGGVAVPDEISLIGYDDIEFAEAAVVPLSSIHQQREEFARAAVDMLLSEADQEPRHVLIEPRLVVRASTSRR